MEENKYGGQLSKRPWHDAETIHFSDANLGGQVLQHEDALIITLWIDKFDVKRILVDLGSSSKVMYDSLFRKNGVLPERFETNKDPLVGFNGSCALPLGKITFMATAGVVTILVEFVVIDSDSPYNAIMGRTWLHAMKAVHSSYH